MVDNIKESTSLKINSEQEIELNQKEKEEPKQSTTELVLTIICVIFVLSVITYLLFIDNPPQTNNFSPHLENKRKTEKSNFTKTEQNSNQNENKKKLIQEKKDNIKCKEGFYLPNDSTENKCKKCTIENCSECSGSKEFDICTSCMESFTPIYDKKKRIKSCIKKCQTGKEEKCLTCNSKMECSSCNPGYKLEEGKCIINYSFKAKYKTNRQKQNINLINKKYADNIVELIIDNQKVNSSYNHTFKKKGIHSVKMLLNTDGLDTGKMMFFNISRLISINFTEKFNTTNMLSMKGMFKDCKNLQSIKLSNFKTDHIRDFSFMFDNCESLSKLNISNFNTEKSNDISYMFGNCISLTSLQLNSFNTKNVVDMGGLFSGCSSLTSIDLSSLNTKNVKYMLYMFQNCSSLKNIDISSFNTENLRDMSYMFRDCSKLKNIDLSKFNTQNVSNLEGIFMGCSNLDAVDLKNLDTRNIKSVSKMFYGCKKLKSIDISSFKNITNQNILFDENIEKSGNLIVSRGFYNLTKENIPTSWKIEFK